MNKKSDIERQLKELCDSVGCTVFRDAVLLEAGARGNQGDPDAAAVRTAVESRLGSGLNRLIGDHATEKLVCLLVETSPEQWIEVVGRIELAAHETLYAQRANMDSGLFVEFSTPDGFNPVPLERGFGVIPQENHPDDDAALREQARALGAQRHPVTGVQWRDIGVLNMAASARRHLRQRGHYPDAPGGRWGVADGDTCHDHPDDPKNFLLGSRSCEHAIQLLERVDNLVSEMPALSPLDLLDHGAAIGVLATKRVACRAEPPIRKETEAAENLDLGPGAARSQKEARVREVNQAVAAGMSPADAAQMKGVGVRVRTARGYLTREPAPCPGYPAGEPCKAADGNPALIRVPKRGDPAQFCPDCTKVRRNAKARERYAKRQNQ